MCLSMKINSVLLWGLVNSKNSSICESLRYYVSTGTSFTIVSSTEVSALFLAASPCTKHFSPEF